MEWTGYPEEHPDLIAKDEERWNAEHEAQEQAAKEAEAQFMQACQPFIDKAVAEARERALEEAAKWHDESEAYYTKHAGNYAVNDEHHKRHLQMALHHRQSAAWIRALKGKTEGGV